jgi:hypothetical protein
MKQLAFKSTYLRENCYISGAIVNVALAKHVLGNVDDSCPWTSLCWMGTSSR